jgi:hypothetical protein
MPEEKKVVNTFSLKKELDEFKEAQAKTTEKILGLLENLAQTSSNKPAELKATQERRLLEEDVEAGKSGFLPDQYKTVFEKYFNPEDGFSASLEFPSMDDKGNEAGGIMFTIVVPNKFSNANEAYLKYYKRDLRSKALQPGAVAKGIDEWCKRVAKNLRYDKRLR